MEANRAQMSNLENHGLPESICVFAFTGVSEDLKTGYLYQIDHKHLPPKSPNQLKAIRVVMLAEKNEMDVSVIFPSSYALHSYFTLQKKENTVQPTRKYPDLDEQFVMGLKLAKVILTRPIFPPELQQQGRLQSFWLVPQNVTEVSTSTVDDNSNDGLCGSTLNTGGFPTWGVRRRITFVKKRMEENTTIQRVSSFSSLVKEEDGAADLDVDSVDDETTIVTRKRKRRSCRNKKKTPFKAFTYEKKKPGNRIAKRPKLSYGRWSRERYKNAEVKMLEIMKEKGAVYERPVLRPALRSEARKHIGDTGLLDHLLKHMSGKVAPNGIDRFRRRHNSDGHMEYWLESADLDDTNTIVMVVYLSLLNMFLLASDSRGSKRVKRELKIGSEINRKFKVYGPFCMFSSGKRKFNRIVHRELAENFSALPRFSQFESFIKLVVKAVRKAKKEHPLGRDKTCSYIISSAEIKDGKFLVQGSVQISTSDLRTRDIRPFSAIGCGRAHLPDSFFSEEDWDNIKELKKLLSILLI